MRSRSGEVVAKELWASRSVVSQGHGSRPPGDDGRASWHDLSPQERRRSEAGDGEPGDS
jgi:hypothetical protein